MFGSHRLPYPEDKQMLLRHREATCSVNIPVLSYEAVKTVRLVYKGDNEEKHKGNYHRDERMVFKLLRKELQWNFV